jgi:hypothetical protein
MIIRNTFIFCWIGMFKSWQIYQVVLSEPPSIKFIFIPKRKYWHQIDMNHQLSTCLAKPLGLALRGFC